MQTFNRSNWLLYMVDSVGIMLVVYGWQLTVDRSFTLSALSFTLKKYIARKTRNRENKSFRNYNIPEKRF
jgi:hypothetical protein